MCFCGFDPETIDLALRTKFCPNTRSHEDVFVTNQTLKTFSVEK